jgi:hypothetical protein
MSEVRPQTSQTDAGWLRNRQAAEEAEAYRRARLPYRRGWLSVGVVSPPVKPERGRWRIQGDFLGLAGLFYFWPGAVDGPSRFVTSKVGIREQRIGNLQITKEPDGRIKVVLV